MLILSMVTLIFAVNFRTFLNIFFSGKEKGKNAAMEGSHRNCQIWAKFKGPLGQLEDDGRKDPIRAGN